MSYNSLMFILSEFNPPDDFINFLRTVNVVAGFLACMTLLFILARPRWKEWNVPTRLGWLALFLFCFTGTYGTFEIKYLDTYFRVPMVTVSLIWGIVAALWPRDKDDSSSGTG